jgi:hypothetical protein
MLTAHVFSQFEPEAPGCFFGVLCLLTDVRGRFLSFPPEVDGRVHCGFRAPFGVCLPDKAEAELLQACWTLTNPVWLAIDGIRRVRRAAAWN